MEEGRYLRRREICAILAVMESPWTYVPTRDAECAANAGAQTVEPFGAVGAGRTARACAKGSSTGLDARVKIALLAAYSIALFCAQSLGGLAVAALLLVAVALTGHAPVVRLLRGAAFVYAIVGFLLIYNIAASGWLAGIAVAARLLLLVWASLLLMALSTPIELSEGLRRLLFPLARLGLPVRDFATSLSIALRFMPLLSEELGAIRAAQASRGAAFECGGVVSRLRAYGGLMVPLLVGLFRRADRLSAAMDARCFGAPGEPTSLVAHRSNWRDGAVLLLGLAACIAFALVP